jgi:hypothetical protein
LYGATILNDTLIRTSSNNPILLNPDKTLDPDKTLVVSVVLSIIVLILSTIVQIVLGTLDKSPRQQGLRIEE